MLSALDRLVAAGEDDETFRQLADAVVRRGLDFDVAAWSTTDPATGLLTSCHVVGLPYDAERERSLFRCEYERDGGGGARYGDLARAPRPAAALSVTTGGNVRASVRYQEILEPIGAVDDLRVVFLAGGLPWGTLTAYRLEGKPPFGEKEVQSAASLAPVVALGLRRGLLRRACDHPLGPAVIVDPPGTLIVDGGGGVVATTPAAERWLDAIGDRGRLPPVVSALAAAARSDAPARELEAVVAGHDGRPVAVHASRAKSAADDHVALVLERPRPAVLAEYLASVHGLTARERDVAGLVLRGWSNKEVATALGTSAFTVNDHLKSIFAKVGVASRGQMAACLLDTHFLPRVRTAQAPGPYGWFLEPA